MFLKLFNQGVKSPCVEDLNDNWKTAMMELAGVYWRAERGFPGMPRRAWFVVLLKGALASKGTFHRPDGLCDLISL